MVNKVLLLIIFLLPLFLVFIYFYNITGNDFLFLHDEYLILNRHESINIFFTQNPISLGIANTTVMIVSFFDRLYYLFLNLFDFQQPLIQRILYFIKLFLLLLLPYIGFTKISRLFIKEQNILAIFFISLWYSFNTYTLIYLHGNAFSLTLLICYALAPLAFYYYHAAVFGKQEKIFLLKTTLVLFFMSFAVYLFAVFLLFLFGYTCLYWLIFRPSVTKVIKNLIFLVLFYIPFLPIILLIPYDMFFSPTNTLNEVGGETFGNLQGGLLYPFLMWFSWGIYTPWEPRNIFTFYKYFYSMPSILAPFIIYALLIPGIFAKKKQSLFFLFLFLFLVFLFLIKGAQDPFGIIYIWLVETVPGFRVFRSPDNKFGFILIFLLCLMLLQVTSAYKKKIFISLLGAVILIQGYLIFNGIAVRGENTATSSDRIVKIPNEYYETAKYLNNNTFPYGYIMPIPAVEFGHYTVEEGKRYIGQDILPKLISLPFVYTSQDSGIATNTYNKLLQMIKQNQLKNISEFPIKYIIIRNDIASTKHDKTLGKQTTKELKKVHSNNIFTVFENKQFVPIIQSENSRFLIDSPIKYRISLKNIKNEQKLYFNQSFNPNWMLYAVTNGNSFLCKPYVMYESYNTRECQGKIAFFESKELGYIFQKSVLASTHEIDRGYANSWTVSADSIKKTLDKKNYTINKDGSINLELVLYFKTQSLFYFGIIVTVIYLLISSSLIMWYSLFKERL